MVQIIVLWSAKTEVLTMYCILAFVIHLNIPLATILTNLGTYFRLGVQTVIVRGVENLTNRVPT